MRMETDDTAPRSRLAPRRLLPRLAVCVGGGALLATLVPPEVLHALVLLVGWGIVALLLGHLVNTWLVRQDDEDDDAR